MKKLILLAFIAIAGLAFTSCTDNTQEHEELLKIQFVDKSESSSSDSIGEDEVDNDY